MSKRERSAFQRRKSSPATTTTSEIIQVVRRVSASLGGEVQVAWMLWLLSHQPVIAMPAMSKRWANTRSGTVTADQRRTSQKVSQQSATSTPSFASELATNGNSVFRETPSATYLTAK